MSIEFKQENLIKKFAVNGTPMEIYFEDAEYTAAESRKLQAQLILTLCGMDYMTV